MEEIKTKVCTSCKRELPISEFYTKASAKYGLQYQCKECHKQSSYRSYKKRKGESTLQKVYSNPELAKFQPRELMAELKARGYRWDYMLEPQRKVMFEKI